MGPPSTVRLKREPAWGRRGPGSGPSRVTVEVPAQHPQGRPVGQRVRGGRGCGPSGRAMRRAPGPAPPGSHPVGTWGGGAGPAKGAERQGGRAELGRPLRAEEGVGCTETVLSLAAARDQAQEEYRAAAEQAVSVRQQAAVRAGFSAVFSASGCGQDFSRTSGGLTLSFGLNACSLPVRAGLSSSAASCPLRKLTLSSLFAVPPSAFGINMPLSCSSRQGFKPALCPTPPGSCFAPRHPNTLECSAPAFRSGLMSFSLWELGPPGSSPAQTPRQRASPHHQISCYSPGGGGSLAMCSLGGTRGVLLSYRSVQSTARERGQEEGTNNK